MIGDFANRVFDCSRPIEGHVSARMSDPGCVCAIQFYEEKDLNVFNLMGALRMGNGESRPPCYALIETASYTRFVAMLCAAIPSWSLITSML